MRYGKWIQFWRECGGKYERGTPGNRMCHRTSNRVLNISADKSIQNLFWEGVLKSSGVNLLLVNLESMTFSVGKLGISQTPVDFIHKCAEAYALPIFCYSPPVIFPGLLS